MDQDLVNRRTAQAIANSNPTTIAMRIAIAGASIGRAGGPGQQQQAVITAA